MQTTATFDRRSQTFELHTPDGEGEKYWVLNGSSRCRFAVVFACLRASDDEDASAAGRSFTSKGRPSGSRILAFLCQIREVDGRPCHGVTIKDFGASARCCCVWHM